MTLRPLIAAATLLLAAGCNRSGAESQPSVAQPARGARVGIDPVPAVHLFENHSEALIVWRRAGVRDRILVHLDGHAALDWLPDRTIARLAAADFEELPSLELHPYAIDGKTLERFGNSNFVYPAARLGLVREFVWVVPDGTLRDPQAAAELVSRVILGNMQMIALDEAQTLHLEGRTIHGTLLGLPVTICELNDLEAFDEPVLLDVDLDYLTTRSATSQEVMLRPLASPGSLVDRLRSRGIRTDIATVSYSTMGGFLPPGCRWLGPALFAALRQAPDPEGDRGKRRAEADAACDAGRDSAAIALWRELAAKHPEDGSLWYELSRAEALAGRTSAQAAALAKAVVADPILADASLFEADAAWLNQRYADALEIYRDYRRLHPAGPFLAYGLSREAGCLMRTGRVDDAIATLRKVIALAPDHGDTRFELGLSLRERGDLDGAIAQFLEARKILPDLATYSMALGDAYASRDRVGEAVYALEAAVSLRPSWARAQVSLGVLLAQAGRPVDAATHLNAASMLTPRDPRIARLLAQLRRQGITTTEVAARP